MKGIKRELFPILSDKTHLNTCSKSALGISVKEAALEFINDWDTIAGMAWNVENKWNDRIEKARENFAKIIGAKKQNIAYMFGNSTAITSIMSSFNFDKGDEVIFNNLDFPAIPVNLMAAAEKGINYSVVKSSDGVRVSVNDYKPLINRKTKMITACHVVSNTGFRVNSDELIELSHDNDIPVFLDTYQSTGTIPLDVKKNDVDFLASGCLKYLLGGFGISFLYVQDDWIEKLNPASIGWMGVDNPFADLLDKLRLNLHRPQDARKFQFGTPYPNAAYTAAAGMDLILDIGINKIYNQNMNLTQELIGTALDHGYSLLTPIEKEQRGSIVNIQMDHSQEKVAKLVKKGFILDARANGIRISPHFYNNSEDVDNLFSELDNIII